MTEKVMKLGLCVITTATRVTWDTKMLTFKVIKEVYDTFVFLYILCTEMQSEIEKVCCDVECFTNEFLTQLDK